MLWDEPFPHFVQEAAVDGDLYRSLAVGIHGMRCGHSNGAVASSKTASPLGSSVFRELIQASEAWHVWTCTLRSRAFVDEVFALFSSYVRELSLFGPFPWRLEDGADNGPDILPVQVRLALVRARRGYTLLPHTDVPRKLASVLFYFPSPTWMNPRSGGTSFYWHNQGLAALDVGLYATRQDVTEFRRVGFQPNTAVGFLRTSNSYHGVERVECCDNQTRDVLVVTIAVAPGHARNVRDRNLLTVHGDVVGCLGHPCELPQSVGGQLYRLYLRRFR